jgi:hypothetical protein
MVAISTGCLLLALAVSVQADVKSRQKSQVKFEGAIGRVVNMFGGKAAKEGIVNTIALKGNKQLTASESSGELIDLDAEKIYTIDFKGKSYKVVTFAEMRKQIEEARAKAKEQAGEKPADKGEPTWEVSFDVKKTGEQKTLVGETCNQFVMTITAHPKGKTLEEGGGMVITSDMWMGPAGSAAREQADFQLRYVKKLLGSEGEALGRDLMSAIAMYPGMQEAMARMQKETAKMQGTPYLTTVVVESVMTAEQAQSKGEEKGPGIGLPKGLGGMFGKKKTEEQPRPAAPPSGAKNRSTIMTSTTELLALETSVAPQDVEIPAGFKLK